MTRDDIKQGERMIRFLSDNIKERIKNPNSLKDEIEEDKIMMYNLIAKQTKRYETYLRQRF